MRTIITFLMAILIVIMPTMAIAQEAASTPALRDCPFNTTDSLSCMACTVYYEAKSEPHRGQVAVAAVLINRTKSGKFPKSICGVVHQSGQFSWRSPAVWRNSRPSQALWQASIRVAQSVLDGDYSDPTNGALFFHNRRASLGTTKRVVAVIGQHIFKR